MQLGFHLILWAVFCLLLRGRSAYGDLAQYHRYYSGVLPLCTLCLGTDSIPVCSVFCLILSNASSSSLFIYIYLYIIWLGLNCVAVRVSVCE